MPTSQLIIDIKDYEPLTVEKIRQISELSHEDKMKIIEALDIMIQSLVSFILYGENIDQLPK